MSAGVVTIIPTWLGPFHPWSKGCTVMVRWQEQVDIEVESWGGQNSRYRDSSADNERGELHFALDNEGQLNPRGRGLESEREVMVRSFIL